MGAVQGTGIDIADVARFQKAVERRGPRMLARLFTPREQAFCRKQRHPYRHYTARFAAKEALFKALGTGRRHGISWQDVEVCRDEAGTPYLALHRQARETLERAGGRRVLLSMSHEATYAVAQVLVLS